MLNEDQVSNGWVLQCQVSRSCDLNAELEKCKLKCFFNDLLVSERVINYYLHRQQSIQFLNHAELASISHFVFTDAQERVCHFVWTNQFRATRALPKPICIHLKRTGECAVAVTLGNVL